MKQENEELLSIIEVIGAHHVSSTILLLSFLHRGHIANGERESEMIFLVLRRTCQRWRESVARLGFETSLNFSICVPERFIHFFPRVHLLFFKGVKRSCFGLR